MLAAALLASAVTPIVNAQQTFAGSWSDPNQALWIAPDVSITFPTSYSNGPLTVGATASSSVTAGSAPYAHSFVGVPGGGYSSVVNTQVSVDQDAYFSSGFSVNFDTPINFGPDSAQQSAYDLGADNYINYSFLLGFNSPTIGDANVILQLEGGATFSDVSGNYGIFELVGGGVGFDFVEFGFDQNTTENFEALSLNGMKVSGFLESISISHSALKLGDGSAGSQNHTSSLWFSQAVPEPSGALLLGLTGMLGLLRRRRTA